MLLNFNIELHATQVNLFDEAEKRGERRTLVSLSPRFAPSQINSIFTVVKICVLSVLGSHVLQYILKRCVQRVLVSHVPQYILKLCVLRVLVSQVPLYILKLCVLRALVSH
jgi:hypothetical protein